MGVGPFGGVAPIGYTSGVSFGGAPRFFPGGLGGVGAVRGAVYRRDVRRGLRETRDGVLKSEKKQPELSRRQNSLNCSEAGRATLWDVVRANPELSALRALLANDIPWVAATLDGKTLAEGADPAAAFPPGEPYDPDAPGLAPLVDERTGAFHVDTLFAPSDAAVDALRTYLLGEGGAAETDPRAPAASRSPAKRETAADPREKDPPTALEMLGAGNATAATLFVAYHVSPDVRLRLPELRRGALLRTALGGAARLMVDRAERDDGYDGYDDGPGGEVVVRGVGSQAGVLGGGVDACNGRIFVVDHVLLPVDVDGVTTPEQKAHAEAIRRAIAAEADADAEAPAAAESGN